MSGLRFYYVLGEGTRTLEGSGFPWSYGVEYNPSGGERPFVLWEGVAHGAVSGSFSAQYILEQNFDGHFRMTNTEWLIPILHRIASGERVSTEEVSTRIGPITAPTRRDVSSGHQHEKMDDHQERPASRPLYVGAGHFVLQEESRESACRRTCMTWLTSAGFALPPDWRIGSRASHFRHLQIN